MKLRPYQQDMKTGVLAAWDSGKKTPLVVCPTGGGKTVLFSNMVAEAQRPALIMAHRQELVSQMSLTLGRYGVRHRVIAPDAVRRGIEGLHMRVLGRRWVDPHAPVAAAGVDTLIRMDPADTYLRSIGFWVGDEGHHFLAKNKWGRAVSMLPPDALGMGVTATCLRADGHGLGVHAHGVYDCLVVGPGGRDLINDGMLTDYRVFAPPNNLDLSTVTVSAGGDYSPKPLAAAVHKSTIVGDVVESYLRIARGKRGITFAVDIEHAREICAAFRAAGIPAAILTGESDAGHRVRTMRQFEAGEILQLVNVDILGEGVDVPACEVVSFARPTMSFGLFVQQFGRALRLMIDPALMRDWGDMTRAERRAHIAASVKSVAYIIDHVGNVHKHGLPDARRTWSLDARERGKRSTSIDDAIPLRTCLREGCFTVYERHLAACPACGYVVEPAGRSRPEFVDGVLHELDPALLAEMRGEAERVMAPALVPGHLDQYAAMAVRKRHHERQQAQVRLRDAIALWAGWQRAQGRDDTEAYKRFFWGYGVDTATACALNRADAEALALRIENDLHSNGIVNRGIA